MKCKACNCEMYLDHVQNGMKIYACANKGCSSYLRPSEGDVVLMKGTVEEARKLAEELTNVDLESKAL